MSKKTAFISIVLILFTTLLGFELLDDDALNVAIPSQQSQEIIATAIHEDSLMVDEWIISSYDNMMRRIGEEEGQDWILMSAIAYSESRFKSGLTSKRGAVGIMQIMPIVGRQFNVDVEQIADPETNIRLAGKLLKQIDKTLKIPVSTPYNDRISIILACYNGGIGHVSDARRLAKSNGENHNSWEVVARYLQMKADPAIYESELVHHGKFSGSRQTEAYVREVLHRYEIFAKMVEEGLPMVAQAQ
ncbi:MAG: transglycosylase SLT domain-containing protein [Alistipes sp.]|nr:transglycosylase SLT domain-containing protein [Alistipes sp.]